MLLILTMVVCAPHPAQAQDLSASAHALGEKAAAYMHEPRAVLISYENDSSYPAEDFVAAQKVFEKVLEDHSLHILRQPPADIELHVRLVENVTECFWVVQILDVSGADANYPPYVAMVQAPLPDQRAAPKGPHVLLTSENLINSQSNPILDVSGRRDPSTGIYSLMVLEPEQVVEYRAGADTTDKFASGPIHRPNPWPRDLRGRILNTGGDAYQVYLPGLICAGHAANQMGQQMEFDCHASESSAWPLWSAGGPEASIPANRNFFRAMGAGNLESKKLPLFFSAAPMDQSGAGDWLLATTDGRVADTAAANPIGGTKGWGGDVVSMRVPCMESDVFLADGPGDWTQPDTLRLFQIENGVATPLGPPLELFGPVTALWPANNGTTAVAVVRDLQHNDYEAFSISADCAK